MSKQSAGGVSKSSKYPAGNRAKNMPMQRTTSLLCARQTPTAELKHSLEHLPFGGKVVSEIAASLLATPPPAELNEII